MKRLRRKSLNQRVARMLDQDMPPTWQRLHSRQREKLLRSVPQWSAFRELATQHHSIDDAAFGRLLADFLKGQIRNGLDQIETLAAQYQTFNKQFASASSPAEQRDHVLSFARALGANAIQLNGDKRAFARWFGRDAVVDRYQSQIASLERLLVYIMQRLAHVAGRYVLRDEQDDAAPVRRWRQLDLENLLTPLLLYSGDTRVREGAFECLTGALGALPAKGQQESVSERTLQYIYRSALDRRQNVWIQCGALSLLATLSPTSFVTALRKQFLNAQADDTLFVRRRALNLIAEHINDSPELTNIALSALNDPSPYVRQGIAEVLCHADEVNVLEHFPTLLFEDPAPQVRAAALLTLPALHANGRLLTQAQEWLRQTLERESNSFVLRTAMETMRRTHAAYEQSGDDENCAKMRDTILPVLAHLHHMAPDLAVRRWAAETREWLWCHADKNRLDRLEHLAMAASNITPGRRRSVSRSTVGEGDTDLGRLAAVLAQRDFGFDVAPGLLGHSIGRGHRFGFRWWRWLHEFRHASTDKRQGFSHVVGRIFSGRIRVPSAILAELAQTKVPGEPLHIASEGGWRPYLPLVDDVISAIDPVFNAQPVEFYTSEGITTLVPPHRLHQRIRAQAVLTQRFAHYAKLRNWQEGSRSNPSSYTKALSDLGIVLRFKAHDAAEDDPWCADPAVTRFFPALALWPSSEWLSRLEDYFFSVYENSLYELGVFLAGAASYFFGKHIYLSHRIKKSRNAIPLVIGGWGTRGKSGTERLKAALFNGLGFNLVSKTTGCEAMFLHGNAYGPLREMFLFRPYDKATIWEQADVIRLADKLNAEVFLWECMALTPSYVEVLQQQWMKDDIATITNTYPDHEDLQGPAGINIPEVMTNFIPRDRVLITSEDQMLPILTDAAARRGTRVCAVTWLEAGLLTEDVLNRFPYQEHPNNVALVLAMADELGVDRDFALKEMADRVVEDLGVLKTYPTAEIADRRLVFINGMSANERHGCLGNWRRMGFADHEPSHAPGTWISTVVNNRADRVARSQVFASILVKDIRADRHFLIGTNLGGLLGYIDDAWDDYVSSWSLWPKTDEKPSYPQEILAAAARHLHVPTDLAEIRGRLDAMLEGLQTAARPDVSALRDDNQLRDWLDEAHAVRADEIAAWVGEWLTALNELEVFAARIEQTPEKDREALERDFHHLLRTWFLRKLVVFDDPHLSGDRLIEEIAQQTPPGLQNRVMGIQNIKGTGLDFVYRWEAWGHCHRACTDLLSDEEPTAKRGLQALAAFQDYGVLCENYVKHTVETTRHKPVAQNELFQAELGLINNTMEQRLRAVREKAHGDSKNNLLGRFAGALEAFLDASDAVRRRKLANRIYKDLYDQRISNARAATELQTLNARQKGGWLLKGLRRFTQRFQR